MNAARVIALLFPAVVALGCTAEQKRAVAPYVNGALSIEQMACLLFHSESSDPAWLQDVCEIPREFAPAVRDYLTAQGKASAMRAGLASDAGAKDACK